MRPIRQAPVHLGLAILACVPMAVRSAPVLEEVVVTATKREVGMQDVPIALSVMSGDRMEDYGVESLSDIANFMPNVHINQAGGGDQIFIRGIGSGVNYGFEQSVGTFVDGIYFGRGQASRSVFLDVARVEVLKGPQSTLFGKNTIAGAINITTARPGDEFEGRIQATSEPKFDGWSSTLTLSGPVTDTIGLRVVGKRLETDGWVHNDFLGEDPSQKDTVGRVILTWAPTDNLDFMLKYESGDSNNKGRNQMISVATPFSISRYQVADPNFNASFGYHQSEANIGGIRPNTEVHDSDWDIGTFTAEWAIGEHTVKATTGYIDYKFENYLDSDSGPLPFLGRGRNEKHEQWSQELLWSSPLGETLEYLVGAYYQTEDLQHYRYTDAILSAAGFGDGSLDASGIGTLKQDTDTYSAFTQVTWNFDDTMRIIAGLRYSDDTKKITKIQYATDPFTTNPNTVLAGFYDGVLNFTTDHFFTSEGATVCKGVAYVCTFYPDFDNKREEDHWTGDLTFQWNVTGDTMLYAKVGNGYKAGGFDEDNSRGNPDTAEYEDEEVISYEVGSKMDLLDGRARFNTAIFLSDFDNVQVSTFDGNAGFVVGNAAKTETYGVEVDGQYLITEELTFSGAVAYLDATYDSFPDAACNEPQILNWIAAGGTRATCIQDLSGERLQFSPEWSANLALDYVVVLDDGFELKLGTDAMYSDEYEVANDQDPVLKQDSFWKIDARIQLSGADDTWSIAILGKNLTDEKTTFWGNDVPLAGQGFSQTYFQMIDAPRSYELQASYRF